MSDCRWGVKPYPFKEYDHTEPIRGKTVFTNGTECKFTYSRTTGNGRRSIDHFEADGTRYMPVAERDWDSGEVTD